MGAIGPVWTLLSPWLLPHSHQAIRQVGSVASNKNDRKERPRNWRAWFFANCVTVFACFLMVLKVLDGFAKFYMIFHRTLMALQMICCLMAHGTWPRKERGPSPNPWLLATRFFARIET